MERTDQQSTKYFGTNFKKKVAEIRVEDGREEKTSFCIIDAQSVKNTDTAENKGYDAGKKVSGIKRHIGVDTGPTLRPLH